MTQEEATRSLLPSLPVTLPPPPATGRPSTSPCLAAGRPWTFPNRSLPPLLSRTTSYQIPRKIERSIHNSPMQQESRQETFSNDVASCLPGSSFDGGSDSTKILSNFIIHESTLRQVTKL